jgi:anti-sigma factor RsiW
MRGEADRLIAAALRDQARAPAPARLRRTLERRSLGAPNLRWLALLLAALVGVAFATLLMLVIGPTPRPAADWAFEAVGDHLRVLRGRELGVEANDMHNVRPWFAGKLEFVPPVAYLGDDEFRLRGGEVAVFLGHRAAAFAYSRRLHAISLFVFEAADAMEGERTIQGFHVLTWGAGGFGFALVSDVEWDELRTLCARVRR